MTYTRKQIRFSLVMEFIYLGVKLKATSRCSALHRPCSVRGACAYSNHGGFHPHSMRKSSLGLQKGPSVNYVYTAWPRIFGCASAVLTPLM